MRAAHVAHMWNSFTSIVRRRALSIVTSFESNPNAMERVTPIVLFANSSTATSGAFHTFASALSLEGYSGLILDRSLVLRAPCVDDAVSRLQDVIRKAGILPPILIASNLTAYLAQKYLESYPLKGLILLDPPSESIVDSCALLHNDEKSELYQSIRISDEGSRKVNLEAGCVPMMIVSTFERRNAVCAVAALHGIAEEDVMLIHRNELNTATYNIENGIDSALLADPRVYRALMSWIDLLA